MAQVPHALESNPITLGRFIRDLFAGRSNAVGTVTLTEDDTTTAVAAINCGPDSKVFLMPTTANAAAEFAGGDLYVSAVTAGSFTLTHANASSVDRSFFYVCLG